jgi:hypothetical protein
MSLEMIGITQPRAQKSRANHFVQATAVCAFLLVPGQVPAAPDDNR